MTAISAGPGEGAKGSGSLGLKVQFENVVPPFMRMSPPRVSGVALAYSTWRLDRRHGRGAERAAGRKGQRSFAQRNQPTEGLVGRLTRAAESACPDKRPLRLLVGRWHPQKAASEDSEGQCLLVIIGVKPG